MGARIHEFTKKSPHRETRRRSTNTLEAREVQAMFASTFPTPHCANDPWDGTKSGNCMIVRVYLSTWSVAMRSLSRQRA